jgi:outer membrane receptor protein involved in Fe transport
MTAKDGARLIVVLIAIALACGGVAYAQNQEDAAGGQSEEVAATASETEVGSETEEARRQKFSGEIVVTSTRRELKVREVPASVSVTEGWELESMAATTMDDYAQQVAGVNYIDDVPQRDYVTMRGISTSTFNNLLQAPVATYVNEIPLTDSFEFFSNFDVMPFDMERVEFLKGPQGTLYGAASLGGTIRYLLNRPNVDRNAGALHLTASSTASGGTNYLAQGMFNVVLAPGKFALRGVVSHEDDAGWIDHAYLGDNFNNYTQTNARLMASWTPSDRIRIDASYMYQNADLASNDYEVDSPDFDNPFNSGVLYAETPMNFDMEVGNFSLYWDLGFAELISSTSYINKDTDWTLNWGTGYQLDFLTGEEIILGLLFGLPVNIGDLSSTITTSDNRIPATQESFFQEFRLVSRDTGRLDWIAGAYYSDASAGFESIYTYPGIEDRVNELAAPFGSLLYADDVFLLWVRDVEATELALYGELGIDLSQKWKLNLGGRYTDYDRQDDLSFTVYGGTQVLDVEPFTMNVFSPKVSLSYRPSGDLLWYGLISRGYRTGGANVSYLTGNPNPIEEFKYYETDNLWNYETGIKKTWAGGKVTTDLTLFYLDWTDIQLEAQFLDPRVGLINAVFNTGKARSVGAEFSMMAQITRGLSFMTGIMWNEAEITEDTPPLINLETGLPEVVPAGSKLPNTPSWSTSATLQYYWDNKSLGYPFVALDHFYKDTYVVYLQSQRSVSSYNLFGLRIGTTLAKQLNLTLTVRNLFDERVPVLRYLPSDGSWIPNLIPERWRITRPRTIALTIQKNF